MSVYTALLTYSDGSLVFAGSTKEILERKLIDHANALPRDETGWTFVNVEAAISYIEGMYDGEIQLEEHQE